MKENEWNMHGPWDSIKRPNPWTMGIEKKEEVQAKDIGNISNKVATEN
jgi:hypothetical protein